MSVYSPIAYCEKLSMKSMYSKVHSEELCNCKIKVSERDLILLQHHVFMLIWPEEFLHITDTVISDKGKNPKPDPTLTTFSTPALSRPHPHPPPP